MCELCDDYIPEREDDPSLEDVTPVEALRLDAEALGSCGCTDYHMADCPIRTAAGDDDPEPYDRDDERGPEPDDFDVCRVCEQIIPGDRMAVWAHFGGRGEYVHAACIRRTRRTRLTPETDRQREARLAEWAAEAEAERAAEMAVERYYESGGAAWATIAAEDDYERGLEAMDQGLQELRSHRPTDADDYDVLCCWGCGKNVPRDQETGPGRMHPACARRWPHPSIVARPSLSVAEIARRIGATA